MHFRAVKESPLNDFRILMSVRIPIALARDFVASSQPPALTRFEVARF